MGEYTVKSMLEHKTAVNFQSIYPKYIIFNLNVDPSKKMTHKVEIPMLLTYDKRFDDEGRKLIASMTVEIMDEEKKIPINIKVCYEGIFTIADDTPVNDLAIFSEYAAAGLILPYIRSEISRITGSTGLRPINIPPINVQRLIASQQKTNEIKSEEEKK